MTTQYTHIVKTSNQKCFPCVWWPTIDKSAMEREKHWPMMVLESGQITRIRKDNLMLIK